MLQLRPCVRFAVLFVLLVSLLFVPATPSTNASTHSDSLLSGQYESKYGGTTIWLKLCGQGAKYRFRADFINTGQTLWDQTYDNTTNGCLPFFYRAIVGSAPGNQFKIYSMYMDQPLADNDFLQRARLDICTVNSPGVIACNRQSRSVPQMYIDAPTQGATIQGLVTVSGWALDLAATTGSGASEVQVFLDNTLLGNANYGAAYPSVAAFFHDSRFTNSAFSFGFDSSNYGNGTKTLRVAAKSTESGQWNSIEQQITISNGDTPPPVTPTPAPPIATPVPQPEIPPLASGLWNVPYYSQVDSRWGNNGIGVCGNTIHNVGCALTSLTMILKYYGADQNPGSLNGCLGNVACPLIWGSPKVATCGGGKVRWDAWPAFSYERLEQELRSRPVILEIRNGNNLHFIVVIGGSGTDPKNYTVNDPGIRNGARANLAATLALYKRTPSSMRLYSGTPALEYQSSNLQQIDILEHLASPQPTADETITGTLALYRNTETEMTLELAAQSVAGDVTEMQISTDAHPSSAWQPFSPYVSVPLDSTFFVRFRDAAGNTSDVITEVTPSVSDAVQGDVTQIYLPVVSN